MFIETRKLIDPMKSANAERNQDVQGDTSTRLSTSLYEYMLGRMQFAGRGGQFRTPRQEEFAGAVARIESLRGRILAI